jgi:hypothetical protein
MESNNPTGRIPLANARRRKCLREWRERLEAREVGTMEDE